MYLGRPIGWGLVYLEIVLVGAVWPRLHAWPRVALLGATVAVMLSHWWALILTAQGHGMPLVTLQSADKPWETLLVLPLGWLLLLMTMPVLGGNSTQGNSKGDAA